MYQTSDPLASENGSICTFEKSTKVHNEFRKNVLHIIMVLINKVMDFSKLYIMAEYFAFLSNNSRILLS